MRRMSDQRIEAVLGQSGIDAEAAEGFFDDLGKIASGVGKAAPAILPVAGTVVGTAFGGPLGGALGRAAGGAIGAAAGPPAPPTVAAPGGSPAAGQLLQTVARPETLQAVMSMVLGPAGKPSVQVGSTPVPVGAFSNLLGVLANRAAAECNAAVARQSESAPAYLRDYAGETVADPAVPAQRADALYELLELTRPEQESDAAESEDEAVEAYVEAQEAAAAEAEAEAWELLDAIDSFESE
jgi:hypothetical protein